MRAVKEFELKSHIVRLQQIFSRRFASRYGDMYRLQNDPFLSPIIYLKLANNSATVAVTSDRGKSETCGILIAKNERRVLCSFLGAWKRGRKDFRFEKAALTFFLEFNTGDNLTSRQMFRLEWDNWLDQDPANTAGYPHWQFDRWLTASDVHELDRLKSTFTGGDQEATVFESAEQQQARDRPNLGWFTRIHFPAIAPWATFPLSDDVREPMSHRSMPNSLSEIEGWVDSALRYLQMELTEYA